MIKMKSAASKNLIINSIQINFFDTRKIYYDKAAPLQFIAQLSVDCITCPTNRKGKLVNRTGIVYILICFP